MGDNRGQTIAWLIGRIDGIEKLLQKIAPKYRLMDGDILTLPDAAVAAQRTVAEPSRPRDWASLPPIQRTAGEMPLVASPGHFVQRLPGSTGLPPIVQPLGHEVSPLASAGLVVARVRAVEAPAPAAVPAPVQRRASRGAQAAEGDMPAFAAEELAPSEAGVTDSPGAAAAPPAEATPIRTMPTVSRQAVRLPERPLTSATVTARPAPVQRTTEAAAADTAAAALPRPSGGMRRVPSASTTAPASPVVSPEVTHQRSTPALAEAAAPAAAPIGPTRRGLGEPMPSAPTTARPVASVLPGPVVSRSTTPGPMPISASSLRPVAQRSAGGGPTALPSTGSGLPGPGPGRSGDRALAELALPHLPVQRSAGAPSLAPVTAPAARGLAPIAPGPEIRPTAGASPIRPSIDIQRIAGDDRDDQPPDDELPSPWWNPAGGPGADPAQSSTIAPGLGGGTAAAMSASVQRSGAGSGTTTTIATVPPRGVDWNRPVQVGRSAPVAAPVQRSVGPALRPSALPQPAGVGARHGATAAAGVTESGLLAQAPSPGRAIGGAVVQASPAGSSASAASALAASSFGGPTVVQREEAPSPAPAAPAPGGSGLPSERDLDELAQALFGRIRGRLRNDLIYDREAKGLTFDNV